MLETKCEASDDGQSQNIPFEQTKRCLLHFSIVFQCIHLMVILSNLYAHINRCKSSSGFTQKNIVHEAMLHHCISYFHLGLGLGLAMQEISLHKTRNQRNRQRPRSRIFPFLILDNFLLCGYHFIKSPLQIGVPTFCSKHHEKFSV